MREKKTSSASTSREQPAPLRSASRPEPAASPLAGEALRVLWFTLGAAATAFGFWVAATLR